ncbi:MULTISPECIES: class I SAM-dependent methyltransferase [Flavobacteriaceae]|uniref:class I SAM-dependent methyltransferase n=1 Tax=Flavobacteriaceae TaxID=49546 RepID=UPI0014917138|nr:MULTISPECIES: class I SAM-dependent methyltransferase [Allomuricauda]MDC6364679.1 class I SAM-dependent methyltransferase [Muricauda sp. AC10]
MKHNNLIVFLIFVSVFGLQAQYTEADWTDRDQWMKTNLLLNKAGVEEGDKVADIGCHEGYLSIHLSKKVKGNGRVYAVDVRSDRLEELRINANKRNLRNIITILGDYDDPKLPERELDFVFIIDTYHEMEAYQKILRHVKDALKPGGKILILEKLKDRIRGKSRQEQVAAHSLSPGYVREELENAGFRILSQIENHGNWERETDKQMWVILAQKPQ